MKNKQKHEEAKQLILEGKMSMIDIAKKVGFTKEAIYYIRKKLQLQPLAMKRLQQEKQNINKPCPACGGTIEKHDFPDKTRCEFCQPD